MAVVDANVFGQTTRLDPIVEAAKSGRLAIIWSPLIISEVGRLLTWHWIKQNGDDLSPGARRQCSIDLKRWYAQVAVHFHVVEDRPPLAPMWTDTPRDPWDQPIWTAAVRTKALFPGSLVLVITSNLRDGPPIDQDGLRRFQDITFISPDEALLLIDAVAQFRLADELPNVGEQTGQIPETLRPLLAQLLANAGSPNEPPPTGNEPR
jgi:hypothetical protein